jgi:hypothetical protein
VTAAAKLADEGVPKNVATPVPSDVIPVPPEAGANGEASVKDEKCVVASMTSVPLQYSTMLDPLGIEMPVPAEVFTVIANPPVVLLYTKYSFELLGQMTFRAAVNVPVTVRNILRASSAAPLAVVNV